ncbi:3-oxoacyl-ACP reductase FabG [bacterium]|nr:MAG: 3-oxoacyl-ACP reductase FabG [bacterium]
MCSLENKIAIVTGSSRGIGKAIVECFLKSGAGIVLNGKTKENLEIAEKELIDAGFSEKMISIQADVSKPEEAKKLFDAAVDRFGRVDILVNNAGVFRNSLLARMDESEWDWVIENNLKSAYHCTKLAAKIMMKQRSGRIINMSSVVALGGNPFQANYVASKSGMDGLMMATAKELAPFGITVNSIAPGYIKTDMTKDFTEQMVADILKFIPLNRAGTAVEVAYAVKFLASDESSYITGQVIQVDGGRVIR